MATYTEKLNLKKPAGGDYVDIADINENMDIIDQFAEEVDGKFLPLTGGTLSGNLYFGNGYGRILANNEFVQLQSTSDIGETANRRRLQIYNSNSTTVNSLEQSLKYIDTSYGTEKQYALFGEHNFVINANTSDYDMDVIIRSGEHFRWYITQGQTLNTPYKKGLTGAYIGALIMSYSNGTFGEQVAYIRGTGQVFIRNLDGQSGLTDWVELGGGLMSPTAVKTYDAGGTAQTISGTGKGKIFITQSSSSSSDGANFTSVNIDGKTLSNFTANGGYNYAHPTFELDFTNSFSFTFKYACIQVIFY